MFRFMAQKKSRLRPPEAETSLLFLLLSKKVFSLLFVFYAATSRVWI